MNNLKLYSERFSKVELQSSDEFLQFSTFDVERNRIFFASSTNLIYTTQLSSFQNERTGSRTLSSAKIDAIELEPGDHITSFEYLMEKEALIVGTYEGLLLLHSVDERRTELVGMIEGGVKCFSPSPDGDLLCIISGIEQILVMTHDWDLLYESPLRDLPRGVDVNKTFDKGTSSIAWRGDGKYFVTLNEVGCNTSNKILKVWERDSGTVVATSETKPFMGAVLEWMPSGAKIAAVYDKKAEGDPASIVFFERNGLERSMFRIDEQIGTVVESLKWNCSSDLLAAVVRCEKYDAVKIWCFSNNHWFLKHEIRYLKQDAMSLMWDLTKPLQLICWTIRGHITIYNFVWNTAIMENSAAFVIDDSKILVTPLSLSLMPSPMYMFCLKFDSAVKDIAFYSKNSRNCLATFLSNGFLSIIELPALDFWEELEGKEFIVEASISESAIGSFLHLVWLDFHKLLAVSQYGVGYFNNSTSSQEYDNLQGFHLLEIDLECSEDNVAGLPTYSGWHSRVSGRTSLEELVLGVKPNPGKKCSAFVQFDGGKIYEYESQSGFSAGGMRQEFESFSSSCPWMSVVPMADSGSVKPLFFGLDDSARLHFNGIVITNNCSSFSFYSNMDDQVMTHLIVSTKHDMLFVVDINDILHGELESKYNNFIQISNKRREENKNFINVWERGAKIVGVLHGDGAAVILQTTRGNLECIYPRKLVLSSIVNALVQVRFRDALLMVRRHRIDFNIIVDHCGWEEFLQSAPEFVKQVNNFSYITEFVCAMKNERITETLYKDFIYSTFLSGDEIGEARESKDSNKVTSVLNAIRKAVEEQLQETPARELCILTTLARCDPPALEEALERIKAIRDVELLDSDESRRASYPSSEEALKHLLWLSDSDAIFEAALGLYDLKLAAIVALNSQRDPKEFLPFLQDLENMPFNLMCYNIDLKLKRFEKALKHIVSCGDAYFAECMDLIKTKPQLFPSGLQLISDPSKRTQILEAWGDHLSDEKLFEDAASTYLCCSKIEKALKSYQACGNWNRVFVIAGLLKVGNDELMQMAHELCEELQAIGKPGEAAKIALEYCGDINNGINFLIAARDWEEALRVAFMKQREDLISEVKNASMDCASALIGEYEEGLEKTGKYTARYLAVRQRRLLLAAKIKLEENSINNFDDYDTASETSSNFSGMSAYTTGTRRSSATTMSTSAGSKMREARRQKSRGKIRPGSPGEEMALVEHLKSMSLTDGSKSELKSLIVSLMMLGEEETARKLQRSAEKFQLTQMAAVQLADHTFSQDNVNEQSDTMENYIQKVKSEIHSSNSFFWRSKVFPSP